MKSQFNTFWENINTMVLYSGLNLVFLLCCLPIVTIGPAAAALGQVMSDELRGEYKYIFRSYFRHFKEMLLQGILTELLFGSCLAVLVYALAFWYSISSPAAAAAFTVTLLAAVVVSCAMIYAFPLMARFQNSFRQTIRNAFHLSLAHPGCSLLLLLLRVFLVSLLYLFPVPSRIFMLVIGFSALSFSTMYILERIFRPLIQTSENPGC